MRTPQRSDVSATRTTFLALGSRQRGGDRLAALTSTENFTVLESIVLAR